MAKGMERLAMDRRIEYARFFILGVMCCLLWGLAYFQLVKGDRYVELASSNRLRIIRLLPPRGVITDAAGTPLAVNVRTFDIKGYPMEISKPDKLALLCALLNSRGIPTLLEELISRIEKQYSAPYRAVSVASNLTLAQMADLMSDVNAANLIFPVSVWRRVYPAGSLVSHVIGYVGEITAEELENAPPEYHGGDTIGKTGVESYYESTLRGQIGEAAVEVDSRGRKIQDVSRAEPSRGENLALTLDLGAQRLAAELLGGEKGAIVALDVRDGAVKALYSAPTFDTNPLTWGIYPKEWNALLTDKERPMINRAIGGVYPPASTFKIITAMAALEGNIITSRTVINCPGYFEVGNQKFRCWKRTGHGPMNLTNAISNSCDVFFYETAAKMGSDRLVRWAMLMGVGKKTGIDIIGEQAGNAAGREWKRARFREAWYTGDTVNYSIGQGFVLMTPLQLAAAYAIAANGGYMITPHLASEGDFKKIDLKLPQSGLLAMQKGLYEAVKNGTGRRASQYGVTVAGKTGTAQNSHGEDHAWFVGYAPLDNPQYVVVALVEGGGSGAAVTAPIVGQVLSYLVKSKGGKVKS